MEIIRQLFKHYLYLIAIFFIGRLSLFIWQFDRFSEVNESYWLSFVYGLKMDTILALALLFPVLFLLTLSPKFISKLVDKLVVYYYLIVLMLVVYVESATFPFFAQYDVRPNYLFVEYLEHIQEVSAMLIADYKLALLLTFVAMFIVAKGYLKNAKGRLLHSFELSYVKRVALLLPLLLIFVIIEWIGRNEQYAIAKLGFTWKRPLRYAMYYSIILAIFLFMGEQQQFIYFQF